MLCYTLNKLGELQWEWYSGTDVTNLEFTVLTLNSVDEVLYQW